jgi:hypothetical protein
VRPVIDPVMDPVTENVLIKPMTERRVSYELVMSSYEAGSESGFVSSQNDASPQELTKTDNQIHN